MGGCLLFFLKKNQIFHHPLYNNPAYSVFRLFIKNCFFFLISRICFAIKKKQLAMKLDLVNFECIFEIRCCCLIHNYKNARFKFGGCCCCCCCWGSGFAGVLLVLVVVITAATCAIAGADISTTNNPILLSKYDRL